MPSGRKRLRQKMATHKRKKRLRKNRHKKKKYNITLYILMFSSLGIYIFNGKIIWQAM